MPRDWPHLLDPKPTPRKQRWYRAEGYTVAALMSSAALGAGYGVWSAAAPAAAPAASSVAISGCKAIDGDTIRCGEERLRLLGIDAPEMPGHCRPGRDCAPGDPFASKASLEDGLTGTLTIERVGEDRYGRTLALVHGAGGDLSCRQLNGGYARYVARWDHGRRLADRCSNSVRLRNAGVY